MNVQGWMVLGAALVAVLFFGRKALRNLSRKGEGAGCCCEGGGKTTIDGLRHQRPRPVVPGVWADI